MTDILIIGNRPNRNFICMNKIIDSFENNVRIGFGEAGSNNDGSILDELELCNHEYENFVKNDYGLEKILSIYSPRYDKQRTTEIFPKFKQNLSKFNKVYHQPWDVGGNNSYLKSVGCPYSVIGLPRSGFSVMMDKILEGKRIFLVNFSLPQHYDEDVGFIGTHGPKDPETSKREVLSGRGCHNTANEVKIVRWLHDNEIVDASLCLINDDADLSYNLEGMKVSSYIKKKIKKYAKT